MNALSSTTYLHRIIIQHVYRAIYKFTKAWQNKKINIQLKQQFRITLHME
jgi:hypothetical protein